jgi:hypothetical protein
MPGSWPWIPLPGDVRPFVGADLRGVTRLPVAVATLAVLFTLLTIAVSPGFSINSRSQTRPVNRSHPFIGGTAGPRGGVLQAGTGSWKGRGVSYSFQWQRCSARGERCEAVSGATGSSYLVGSDDIGHTLRLSVTARNKFGSTTATSRPRRVGGLSTRGRSTGGSVAFNGSARKMTKLYSVGVDDQGQSPSLWTCLCFEKNDLSLQPDASYGQVFKATVAVGDSNPWNTAAAATSGAGQLSVRRKNNLGKWDWYASAFKVPAWSGALSDINFVNLLSVGYQTSSKDQVGLGLMNNHGTLAWQIHQNSGYANAPSGAAIGSVNYRIPLLPVNYGHWQEFVVGVKWATDNTGAVEVYSRTAGGSWTHVFEKLNEPTYLYGTTPYGTFAKDGSNWGTVIDKIGLYFGALNGAKPTETVYESGLTRASDLATAQSTLP